MATSKYIKQIDTILSEYGYTHWRYKKYETAVKLLSFLDKRVELEAYQSTQRYIDEQGGLDNTSMSEEPSYYLSNIGRNSRFYATSLYSEDWWDERTTVKSLDIELRDQLTRLYYDEWEMGDHWHTFNMREMIHNLLNNDFYGQEYYKINPESRRQVLRWQGKEITQQEYDKRLTWINLQQGTEEYDKLLLQLTKHWEWTKHGVVTDDNWYSIIYDTDIMTEEEWDSFTESEAECMSYQVWGFETETMLNVIEQADTAGASDYWWGSDETDDSNVLSMLEWMATDKPGLLDTTIGQIYTIWNGRQDLHTLVKETYDMLEKIYIEHN
jgi:hypothetical protein